MKSLWFFIALLVSGLIVSCSDSEDDSIFQETLADYIAQNDDMDRDDLIACAGGNEEGLANSPVPTSIFFYPEGGAREFRYFEAENVADSTDFTKYIAKELELEPIFNGTLMRFNNASFDGERMGIVTFKRGNTLHVCNPIRQKTNIKPTEVSADLVQIEENGVNPQFVWQDGMIDENVIYFTVISDTLRNVISGTYTTEKNWEFYDLSNVVLNITDPTSEPMLQPNENYQYTMMGVSEDNWVNLLIQRRFRTY